MNNTIKRIISISLIISLIIAYMPFYIKPVVAQSNNEEDVFNALGIDTSSPPDGYDTNMPNPYGSTLVSVWPLVESYVANSNEALYFTSEYDVLNNPVAVESHLSGSANHLTTVAGDFNGDGRKNLVIELGGKVTNIANGIDSDYFSGSISFIDPLNKDSNLNYIVPSDIIFRDGVKLSQFANGFYDEDPDDDIPSVGYVGERLDLFEHQVQNYLEIVTGDFNGDNIDEVALYIPDREAPRIEIFEVHKNSSNGNLYYYLSKIWTHYLSGNYTPNMVSLVANDLTGDGIDDLVITWGTYYSNTYFSPTKGVMLHGNSGGYTFHKETSLNLTQNNSQNNDQLIRVSAASGDADGDGKDDLIIAGQSLNDIENENFHTRFLGRYIYEQSTDSFILANANSFDFAGIEDDKFLSRPGVRCNLVTAKLNGAGDKDFIYCDSVTYELAEAQFSVLQHHKLNFQFDNTSSYYYYEFNARAADINHQGKESIVTQVHLPDEDKFNTSQIPSGLFWRKDTKKEPHSIGYYALASVDLTEAKSLFNTNVWQSEFSFAFPDLNKDTPILKYTGQNYYTYSDPNILAVIASPPYFKDLEHLDNGSDYVQNSSTSYTDSSGSSSGTSSTKSFNVGAYVNYQKDFTVANFEIGVEYTHTRVKETVKTKSISQDITYSTSGGQDTVVLYSVPINTFVYDALVPVDDNGTIVYKNERFTINIPNKAVVKTYSIKEYDSIAKNYDALPTLGGKVLTHQIGVPSSYPKAASSYKGVKIYDGEYMGPGFGTEGSISQQLSFTDEESKQKTKSNAVDFNVGGGGWGVTVGIHGGYEKSNGTVTTTLTGDGFTGTVAGMPLAAKGYGYDYGVKVFKYDHNIGDFSFPVVNYLVSDVKSPPQLPNDFRVNYEEVTHNSVSLSWTKNDNNVFGYQVYRTVSFPEGDIEIPVGDVISANDPLYLNSNGEYIYKIVDKNLVPNNIYKYSIISIGNSESSSSVMSKKIICYTKSQNDIPVITLDRSNLNVYPDTNVSINSSISNTQNINGVVNYQWQKKSLDKWQNLANENSSKLNISSPNKDIAGEYRLIANVYLNNIPNTIYSDIVNVSFEKRDVAIVGDSGFSVSQNSNKALVKFELNNANSNSLSVPTGNITFIIKSNDYYKRFTKPLVAVNSKSYAQINDWEISNDMQNNVYEISAIYSGNRVFKSSSFTGYKAMIGNGQGYWLNMSDRFVYGDNASFSICKYNDSSQDYEIVSDDDIDKVRYYKSVYKYKFLFFFKYKDWEQISDAPKDVGEYRVYIDLKDGKTVSKTYVIESKDITVTGPAIYKEFKLYSLNNIDVPLSDFTLSEQLPYGETLQSLGYSVRFMNSAGKFVDLKESSSRGKYDICISGDYNTYNKRLNYNMKTVYGSCFITGTQIGVNIDNESLYGNTVGSYELLSHPNHVNGVSKYESGAKLVLAVKPLPGYEVSQYELPNNIVIAADSLSNPNIVTIDTSDYFNDLSIKVKYKVIDNKLFYGSLNSNGEVICSNSSMLTSGTTVIKGAKYQFKAIPKEGYVFKGWQVMANHVSYPEGGFNSDGTNTLDFEMGIATTSITGIFERESYTVSLADNLVGSYLWDDDNNTTTPNVIKYFTGTESISGDTEISVMPSSGYSVSEILDDENNHLGYGWIHIDNLTPITSNNGQLMKFILLENQMISATLEQEMYSIKVNLTGNYTDENEVLIKVNGELITGNSTDMLKLSGGALLEIIAVDSNTTKFKQFDVKANSTANYSIENNILKCSSLDGSLFLDVDFINKKQLDLELYQSDKGSLAIKVNDIEQNLDFGNSNSKTIKVYEGDKIELTSLPSENFMFSNWVTKEKVGNSYENEKEYPSQTLIIDEYSKPLKIYANYISMCYFTVNFELEDSQKLKGKLTVTDGSQLFDTGDKIGGGTDFYFKALPNAGYMIDYWVVDGEKILNDNGDAFFNCIYSVKDFSKDITATVYFKPEQVVNLEVQTQNSDVYVNKEISPYYQTTNNNEVWVGSDVVIKTSGVQYTGAAVDGVEVYVNGVLTNDEESDDFNIVKKINYYTISIDNISKDIRVNVLSEPRYLLEIEPSIDNSVIIEYQNDYFSSYNKNYLKANQLSQVTVKPKDGYLIKSVVSDSYSTIDENSLTKNPDGSWTFTCSLIENVDNSQLYGNSVISVEMEEAPSIIVNQVAGLVSNVTRVFNNNSYYAQVSLDTNAGYKILTATATDINGNTKDFTSIVKNENGSWLCVLDNINNNIKVNVTVISLYHISVLQPNNGLISVNTISAGEGETISITATANNNYKLKRYIVKDENGNLLQVNNSSFIMPNCNVSVNAEFIKIQSNSGGSSTPPSSGGGGFMPLPVEDDISPYIETPIVNTVIKKDESKVIYVNNITVTTPTIARAKVAANLEKVKVNISCPIPEENAVSNEESISKTIISLNKSQVFVVRKVGLKLNHSDGTSIEIEPEVLATIVKAKHGLTVESYNKPKDSAKEYLSEYDNIHRVNEINTSYAGKTVIKYKAPVGIDLSMLKIKVVHSDGSTEEIQPTIEDINGINYVSFEVNRFSTFIMYTKGEAPVDEAEEDKISVDIKLTVNSNEALINGDKVVLEASPFINPEYKSTLVPLRFVSKRLGAEVIWHKDTRQVEVNSNKHIVLTIDSKEVFIDDIKSTIQCPAVIYSNKTYVPIRFIGEALGCSVSYNSETQNILINK